MGRLQKELFLLGVVALLAGAVPAALRLSLTREEELGLQMTDARVDLYRVSLESDKELAGDVRERRLQGVNMSLSGKNAKGELLTAPAEEEPFSPGSERDYLNHLVAKTAAATDVQLGNIAFVKTHKTASTTLAYLLFRYSRRHGVKLAHFDGHHSAIPLREAAAQTANHKGRVDIMHYHMSVFGHLKGSWQQAEENYRLIMKEDTAVNFVTVVREPREHLLSYYYYFIQPDTQKSIEKFLTQANNLGDDRHLRLLNPLSAEFGVKTDAGAQYFVDNVLPRFKLVILTEEFDEGLMVLRRLLGWQMIDMTYSVMYKTEDGSKRYDGKPLVNKPRFEDLPQNVQDLIDHMTKLDRILYDASVKEYEKRRDAIAREVKSDLVEFKELQSVVTTYLDTNASSKGNVMYHSADIYSRSATLYPF